MSVVALFAALSLAHVDAFVPPANALLLRRHPTIHASRIIAAPSVARTTAAEMAEVVAPALAATATTPTLTVEVASAKKARPATPWKTLLRLCAPDLPLLVGAFVMLTVAATGDALLPALQGAALNTALGLETQGHASLRGALLQLLGVGIGTAIATGIRGFLFWICGARLVQRLRATLFEALLAQPQAFHDAQGPGELSSRLATDCVKLGDVLSLNVNIVLRQVLQSVAGVAIIMRLNGKLAGLVLLGVALRSTFAHFYSKATRRISQAQQNALAASSGVAEQCLSLIKVVRSHGNDGPERARYGGQLDRLLALQSDQGMLYGFSRVFNGGINAVLLVAILAVGASFVSTGVLPKESLTSFVLYVSFISDASGDVADQWSRIQEALGAATEVFDYLEPRPLDLGISKATATAPPPPPPPAEAESAKAAAAAASAAAGAVGATRGSLSLDCVDFAYPSRPTQNVFEGLSLTIPAGQRVAIVGGSGSGKSTIFALALRFYAPASGAVKLDGVDVSAIAEAEMRRKIAWVQQEPPLFPNSTIRENIAYGLKECPLETVEAAAKEANAHDFIDRLPLGYDTRIGGAGASLSGGQKQRVALARALVRDPSLLLLDEATSALDPESEQLVEAAIARAARERTVLFTTHKVAQARAADRIIVLSRGHIIEDGTHAELLRLGGAYASLLKMGDDVSEEQAASVVDMVEQGGVVALADA